jgi:hypothetical protein
VTNKDKVLITLSASEEGAPDDHRGQCAHHPHNAWSMSMCSPTCRDATKLEPTYAAEAYETSLGTAPETCVGVGGVQLRGVIIERRRRAYVRSLTRSVIL